MKETEWVEIIAEQLRQVFSNETEFLIETQRKLPYAYEILSYKKDWTVHKSHTCSYVTDLLISELGEEIKPRIVIEAKVLSVTTHDAITYSQKATMHKAIHPYLRYGIMLGSRGSAPLPGRLFRHGSDFDFMINFAKYELSKDELKDFIELIKREFLTSKRMEEMLFNSRASDRQKYWIFEKRLKAWESPFERSRKLF